MKWLYETWAGLLVSGAAVVAGVCVVGWLAERYGVLVVLGGILLIAVLL